MNSNCETEPPTFHAQKSPNHRTEPRAAHGASAKANIRQAARLSPVYPASATSFVAECFDLEVLYVIRQRRDGKRHSTEGEENSLIHFVKELFKVGEFSIFVYGFIFVRIPLFHPHTASSL